MTATAAASRALDAVVVVHALFAIAAFVVLVTLRAAAVAGARGGELPASARRSFTGRRELAGRVVHVVPLTGLWVLSVSRGAYGPSSPFVVAGLALWAVIAASLESVAFPAQREVAAALAGPSGDVAAPARRMARAVEVALAALVVAAGVMIAAQS